MPDVPNAHLLMNTRLIQKYHMYIYEIFLFVVLLVMATRASVIVTTNNTLQGTYLSAQIFYQGMQRIQTQA